MNKDKLAQALRAGLEAAQELLAIKREALGDDYTKTRGYWEAERELSAALAAHEAEKQAGPVAGWKLVPEKPTKAMLQARPYAMPGWVARDTYKAMVSAVTAPPSESDKAGPVADDWRRLALRFDGQRMAAMVHLRTLLAFPDAHAEAARAFLAATPSEQIASAPPSESDKEDAELTDEQILRAISPDLWHHIEGERRAQALKDARAVLRAARAKKEQP